MLYLTWLIFVKSINAYNFYQAADSCVFNPIQNISLSSILQCAIECEISDCKAFQFNTINFACSLYSFHEICQSNTNCSNVTIFINNRFNNQYSSDYSSVPFQLFKGINVQYDGGSPTAFNILNPNQTIVALTGNRNRVMVAIGSYRHSQMIIYPKSNLIDEMDTRHAQFYTMGNNFVTYLTKGNCTKYFDCYHSINKYKKYIGIRNLVFGITRTSVFDFTDLKHEITRNNWHVIISGTFWLKNQKIRDNIQSLANIYGVCITKETDSTDWFIRHNICKNVTFFKSFKCG